MAEKRTIFHIDVNSAFLSWTSAHNIENGKGPDLRKMAAVIGGDRDSRHGIVRAKSDAAKKAGIHTAMTISEALTLCPNLVTAPPDFRIYRAYSARLMKYLRTLTPLVEQASIDEAYLDLSSRPEISAAPVEAAYRIKDHIRNSFGFTVNVGISENKVLAKMASDFEKPDRVHTLFKNEIREKMWPLPVSELYMAGRSSVRKLKEMGINDIGDLARSDPALIERRLKSHGRMLWLFANGIDDSPVKAVREEPKGIGSSTTLPVDVTAPEEADRVLKELCAQVSRRLDKAGYMAGNICVEIKYSDFSKSSRQHMLSFPVSSADRLLAECTDIFRELWDGSPVRLLGVRASKLVRHGTPVQISIMDMASPEYQKEDRLESTLEEIKKRYGQGSVKRGSELEKR